VAQGHDREVSRMNDRIARLLKDYDEWSERREAIWAEEAEGWDEYSSDDMGYSDDDGVELLEALVDALREEVPS
jgi:hypothetical protein